MSQISKICTFHLIDDTKRFCEEMLQKIGSDETFLDSLCFSYEAVFHFGSTMNRHNCRIRISQPPQEIIDHQSDMPEVATVTEVTFMNTWCEIEYHFDVC
jgi:hypothetical protein